MRADVLASGDKVPVVGTVAGQLAPLGYQQISSATLAAATGLTIPAGAKFIRFSVEAQAARWRDDGTDPTATVGMQVIVGSEYTYSGDLTAVKFIASTAGAILNVSYYG